MKPRVTFPDPMLATLPILKAETGLWTGVTFGTKPFDVDKPQPLPYVAVHQDATGGRYPVLQTATLRVSVWATADAQALDLAKRVHAVLLSYAGGEEVRSYGELTGPVPTTDPDSRGPLSYFTVAARLRPITL